VPLTRAAASWSVRCRPRHQSSLSEFPDPCSLAAQTGAYDRLARCSAESCTAPAVPLHARGLRKRGRTDADRTVQQWLTRRAPPNRKDPMNLLRRLTAFTRPALAIGVMIVLAESPDACAPEDPPPSKSQTTHPCSPNYIDENENGLLSVQQRGPHSSIQWGAYPTQRAAQYHVKVYIGTKVIDSKKQNYAPHGSFPGIVRKNGRQVPSYLSGQIFKLVGTSYDPKGNVVQQFFIKCRLV
jgi:hypothetical protein